MKFLNKQILLLIAILGFSGMSFGQMVGTDAFLMAPGQEVGVHTLGFEGSSALPPFPTHWRGFVSRLGFLSNPLDDDWTNYDGDFFMPGSPENGFGLEVGGVSYDNNSSGFLNEIPSDGLSDYEIIGRCKFVTWTGSVGGIDIEMTYKMDTTKVYYSVNVVLTNTNPTPATNLFFYKTCDPDNNQDIGWGFPTTNTIVSQPSPFCSKALVTAVDVAGWTSYLGFGGIGADTRVSRGSFSVRDGSDIWNGVGGLIGVVGSSATADQAISICNKTASLASGASKSFDFVVIMSEEQAEEAILSLYYVGYDGAGGPESACTSDITDVEGDGDADLVPDTISACGGLGFPLFVDGPLLGGYSWQWYADGVEIPGATGPEYIASPADTTMYKVVGTPLTDCYVSDIERFILIATTGDGPIIEFDSVDVQCGSYDLNELVYEDINDIPGTITTWYSAEPDSIGDPSDVRDIDDPVYDGDDVWLMIADTSSGCYSLVEIPIPFSETNAGEDSLGLVLCNSGVIVAELDSLVVGGDLGGIWEESSDVMSGGFTALPGTFDPTDVAAGDYKFDYIVLGDAPCPSDTATMFISVVDQPTAGANNTGELCNDVGATFDLNTLLTGSDGGGFWEATVPTGGAFDPATGIFTVGAPLAAGDYTFEYIVLGSDPCINDTSSFTVTVNPLPMLDAGPDQSICIGDETTVNASGDPATYTWDPMGIVDGVPFTPAVGEMDYTVTAVDPFGCVSTDELTIVVHALPVISFVATDLDGCTPFETTFEITSDVEIATTDWMYGDGDVTIGSTLPTVTHTYLYGGLYDVSATVTDIYGCQSTVEYDEYITVEDMPVAAFTQNPQSVYTNDTEVNFTNESLYATDYSWDFGDGSETTPEVNPTHSFPDDRGDIFYPVELTAWNYLGCTDKVTVYLNVKSIIIFYIPNTFTPDGDQFNEEFLPVFDSGYDPFDYHLMIFNRYGEMVFESFNAAVGWDGTYGDRGLVDDGVYTWQIDFKEKHSDKRHMHNGHITVLK
jgi:gliding motility-associated-like protein